MSPLPTLCSFADLFPLIPLKFGGGQEARETTEKKLHFEGCL